MNLKSGLHKIGSFGNEQKLMIYSFFQNLKYKKCIYCVSIKIVNDPQ